MSIEIILIAKIVYYDESNVISNYCKWKEILNCLEFSFFGGRDNFLKCNIRILSFNIFKSIWGEKRDEFKKMNINSYTCTTII